MSELDKALKILSQEWGLPDIRTWRQGRFIDHPRYNHMGKDWKREQEFREATLVRPNGGTNNALFQVSGAEDNTKIVEYLEEIATLLTRIAKQNGEEKHE